jgi:hypothetical protein
MTVRDRTPYSAFPPGLSVRAGTLPDVKAEPTSLRRRCPGLGEDTVMPDRYAAAVRARRAELAEARALLAGSHRAELRSELALSRLVAVDALATALAHLARESREHIGHADRAVRLGFPMVLVAALDLVAAAVHQRWSAELAPGLRRIAAARSLGLEPAWPQLPPPRLPVLPAPPAVERVRAARTLLTGAVEGLALWRLVLLPLAALLMLTPGVQLGASPTDLGPGVPAWPALLPLAAGVGVAGAVVVVRSRRVALERLGLRRCAEETIAAARVALEADLGRRVLEVERWAGAELDAAVSRRRRAVDAEWSALAPDREVADA